MTKAGDLEIIGVVADVKVMQLGAPTQPEMYRDYRQYMFAGFGLTLTLRTGFAPTRRDWRPRRRKRCGR